MTAPLLSSFSCSAWAAFCRSLSSATFFCCRACTLALACLPSVDSATTRCSTTKAILAPSGNGSTRRWRRRGGWGAEAPGPRAPGAGAAGLAGAGAGVWANEAAPVATTRPTARTIRLIADIPFGFTEKLRILLYYAGPGKIGGSDRPVPEDL